MTFKHVLMEEAGSEEKAGGGGHKEPETFSKDYVRELRAESNGYRTRFQEAEAAKKAAEEKAAKAIEESDKKIKDTLTAMDQRVIRAELKAEAIKAGMVDLDGLKLADLSKINLNEAGEVEGAEELMTSMKKAKPWLFGAESSSTSTKPPSKEGQKPKSAKDMTAAEWSAARKEAIRGTVRAAH